MRDPDGKAVYTLCLGLFVGLGIGLPWGCSAGVVSARKEAIDAGAAHWEIDPRTSKVEFVYDKAGK